VPAAASGPEAQPTSSSTSATAAIQPGDGDDAILKDDTSWLTPEKRRTILQNARQKAAAEYTQRVESTLGFSLSDDNAVANVKAFLSDPRGYIAAHAQHFGIAPAVEPPRQPTPAPSNGFTRPTPSLVAQNGTAAYAQAEVDALFDYQQQRIAALESALQPMQQTHQQIQSEQAMREIHAQAAAQYDDMRTWPGFDELKGDVLAVMQSDRRISPETAYRRVMQTKYLPTQEQRMREKLLAEINAAKAETPKGPSAITQSRTSAAPKRGGLSVHDAVQFAVEKHTA
jgi:hypothetical protein